MALILEFHMVARKEYFCWGRRIVFEVSAMVIEVDLILELYRASQKKTILKR